MTALFNSDHLSQDHWLFLQFLLYFILDNFIIFSGKDVLIVIKWIFIGSIPDLKIDIFSTQSHFHSHTIFLFHKLGVIQIGLNRVKNSIHFIFHSCILRQLEVIANLSFCLMFLLDCIFIENGKVVLKCSKNRHISRFFRYLVQLDRINGT